MRKKLQWPNGMAVLRLRLKAMAAAAVLLIGSMACAADVDDNNVSEQQVGQILAELQISPDTSYLSNPEYQLTLADADWRVAGGAVVFQKNKNEIPILGGYVYVYINENGKVAKVEEDSTERLAFDRAQKTMNSIDAESIAVAAIDDLQPLQSNSELVWYREGDSARLAWQIETLLADVADTVSPTHFYTTVDAVSGDILSQSQIDTKKYQPNPGTNTGVFPRIVINDTIGPVGSRAYAQSFDSVVSVGGCTGTLIAPNVVISARHCGIGPGGQVRFGANSNNPDFVATVQNSILPDGGGSLLDGGDVAILILTGNVPANVAIPSRLVDETSSLVGQVAATIGYGFNGVGSSGHGFTSDGRRWGGENIIDRYGAPASAGGSNILSTDFDNGSGGANTIGGSSSTPLEFEATTAPGDSGGPLMVTVGGELAIAGVLSGGTTNTSVYGDISWWTGTADFRAQIEAAGGQFTDGSGGPENDNWADKIEIASVPGSVSGSNNFATVEADEQDLDETGATVWWCATAPADGIMTVDTLGSDFNTQLHVYRGGENGFSNLQLAASNNDSMDEQQSLISFPVEAGQRYDIRVGGFANGLASQGAIQLSVDFAAEGPTDFFFSVQDAGAFNTSNAEATVFAGTSGSIYVFYDPTNSDIDTGAFFDIQTSVPGVIEFTNAEAFEFDITANGIPFAVRWGDGFGETGTVTADLIDEWGAVNVVSGEGMLASNTGPVILDEGYDMSSGAFLFGRIDFNVVGEPGTSVDILAGPGATGIVSMGGTIDAGIGTMRLNVSNDLPPETDFFWSFADLAGGAVNDSTPVGNFAEGSSGSMYLYFDPLMGDIDTGAFFDLQTTSNGVIEFTNAIVFDFDISVSGTPFSVRWGDAFGETGAVTANSIDEWGAANVISGEGMVSSNTGPTFFDEGYDMSAEAFLFGRVDFNVIGSEGDSVDILTSAGSTGIVHMGMTVNSTIGMATINIGESFLLGDVNCDGTVDLLDVNPFVDLLTNGEFSPKADINQDGSVDLLDVNPFVELLSGG